MKIGIIGAGAMGSGIAQVASQAGHEVILTDLSQDVLNASKSKLAKIMNRLVEKEKITCDEAQNIQSRIIRLTSLNDLKDCSLVIEAVVERMDVKNAVFSELEGILSDEAIIASNTSSLSITSIAKECRVSDRIVVLHSCL